MKVSRIISILLLAAGSVCRVQAQDLYNAEHKYPVQQLQEDLKVLRNVLEEVHPGLYRYSTKKTIDSLFDSLYQEINHPLTEIEFYRIVNRMVIPIRDEHTFTLPSKNYWNSKIGQTVYYNSAKGGDGLLFPFFIRILDHRLYIDNNLSEDTSLSRGDEILEINGQSTDQLLKILLPTIHTNGYIESFRNRNLEQFSMHQTYNRFILSYALFIGMPDSFKLIVKPYRGKQKQAHNIAALTSKKIYQNYWRRYSTINDVKKSRENPFEFKLLDATTAYLRLSDFHTDTWLRYNYSTSSEFRSVAEVLRQNSVKNLIIDLRGNEGGDLGIGIRLMPYLALQTFQPYQYHEVKNYRFPELKKFFTDSTAFPTYPDQLFIRQSNGTFISNTQYDTEHWSRPKQPDPNNYKNKLYVLVNGATGSAASIFATLIRVNRRDAIFVGEETGGDMEGPVSGSGADITLPNSKIRVDIPWIRRVVNLNGYKNVFGHGIIPDHIIVPSLKDFVTRTDTELEYINSMIKRSK